MEFFQTQYTGLLNTSLLLATTAKISVKTVKVSVYIKIRFYVVRGLRGLELY